MSTNTLPKINVDEIRRAGKLIPLSEALDVLATTEPLAEQEFVLDGSQDVKFTLPPEWNDEIRDEEPTFVTRCTASIDGADPIPLTKEAILKMTSSIGLTKDYVMRSPGQLITPQLNWWLKNNGVKGADSMRLLSKEGVGVAVVKGSLTTFPNLPMVERIAGKLADHYGSEPMVDYKINHSLERTAVRLVVPDSGKQIHSARHSADKADEWSLGVQFTNSLVADPETRLNISGYLFAWWCTNGAISTHATSGNYNRRVQGQDYEEVTGWIDTAIDRICVDLVPELDEIDALRELSLEGELQTTLNDLFKQLKVPVPARHGIVDHLVESDDLSAYGLMQSITQAANDPDLTDQVREATMRVGGVVPHVVQERCATCHRVSFE